MIQAANSGLVSPEVERKDFLCRPVLCPEPSLSSENQVPDPTFQKQRCKLDHSFVSQAPVAAAQAHPISIAGPPISSFAYQPVPGSFAALGYLLVVL